MKLPLKLLSPEKVLVGDGRSLGEARRLHPDGRYWLVLPGTPGSKDISSHTLRTYGNEGDPVVYVYIGTCLVNKSKKQETKVNGGRESEPFIVAMKLGVEADIKGFFNHVDHTWLLKFLAHRIKDERFIQTIKKFLQGGIMEDGAVRSCEEGTPQGVLISPCLSNIYLHYVLDLWFDRLFRVSCKGTARFVRYCDDYVAMFEFEEDAKRFMAEMTSRLQKFSLEVEPTKTKMLAFGIKEFRSALKSSRHVDTFSFLGFTHYMRKSRRGYPMVDRKTDAVRLRRKVKEFSAQLAKRGNQGTKLIVDYACSHFKGHLQYYGISGNIRSLRCYRFLVLHFLLRCLNRRSQRRSLTWENFHLLINSFGLAKPKVIHALW